MTRYSGISCLCMLLAVTLHGCQSPAAVAQFTPEDQSTIRKMFEATPGHYQSGDWRSWAALWSEDGFFYVPNQTPLRGRAALEAWGEKLPPIDDIRFGDIQVQGEGNLAFGTSTYVLALRGLPVDSGKQLAVFRRQPGTAEWKVVAASFNSDLPLARPESTKVKAPR